MNSAITSQHGIRSQQRDFSTVDVFRNGPKLDNGRLSQYNFFQGGFAKFFWITLPTFMELGNKDLLTKFKNYTEKGHTSFDGIQDMTANTEDITGGIAGNSFKQMNGLKDEFDSFTIKCYEQIGSPLREALSYWLTGIRDPKSGYATYQGLIDTIDGGYDARNHTAELLYVVTDPSGSENGIEYACFITNIIPTKVPMSHLNMQHGEHQIPEFDLEFTGVKYESTYINQQAKAIYAKNKSIEHYLEYRPANDLTV